MFTLAQIKTEIADAAYAGLSDQDIVNKLNRKEVVGDFDVPIDLVRKRLLGMNVIGAIDARIDFYRSKLGALAVGSPEEVKLAALYTAQNSFSLLQNYEITSASGKTFIGVMLTALVAEGLMTTQQRTAILNLGDGVISRAEELWGRGTIIELGHVARARR